MECVLILVTIVTNRNKLYVELIQNDFIFFNKKNACFFTLIKLKCCCPPIHIFQLYMTNELCMLTMLNICSLNTFFYVYDTAWFDRFVNILLWRLCEFSTFARFYHLFHCWYVANQKLESLCNKFYSAYNTGSNGRSPHGLHYERIAYKHKIAHKIQCFFLIFFLGTKRVGGMR